MTSMAFAYGGHVLMVEIQSEMAKPKEFHKVQCSETHDHGGPVALCTHLIIVLQAVYASQGFMLMNYAVVGQHYYCNQV